MVEPTVMVVSIDTEEDNWLPTRDRLTVENIRELPRLNRLFERVGARATYLTKHAVASAPRCAGIVGGLARYISALTPSRFATVGEAAALLAL